MYVCLCRAVTDSRIREAIDTGATDPVQIAAATGAGTGCGSCVFRTCALLKNAGVDVDVPPDRDSFRRDVAVLRGTPAGAHAFA